MSFKHSFIYRNRIEIVIALILFSGVGFTFYQLKTTENLVWLIVMSLFCTKFVMGATGYYLYAEKHTPSMKKMLEYVLLRLY